MESHSFNSPDPIYILDFLMTFKIACNNLSIHEGIAMFLLPHFMQGSSKQDLLHSTEGGSNDGIDDEESSNGALRSYDEVVNYLLQTYTNDGITAATDAASITLKQRENQSPLAFKDVIFAKTAPCGRLYGQAERIHRFMQGLNDDVQNKVRYYFREHPCSTLYKLSRYAHNYDRKTDGSLYTHDDRRKSKKDIDNKNNNNRTSNNNNNRNEYTHARETPLITVNNDVETNYAHITQKQRQQSNNDSKINMVCLDILTPELRPHPTSRRLLIVNTIRTNNELTPISRYNI